MYMYINYINMIYIIIEYEKRNLYEFDSRIFIIVYFFLKDN